MTALAEQLSRGGFVRREVEFNAALARFLNNGGTIERARQLVDDAANRMGSEGRKSGASYGHSAFADASQQNRSGGQIGGAREARLSLPSAATQRDGAGHRSSAAEAVQPMPRSVSPSYVAVANKAAKVLALTVLDSFKVRDGRAIGDVPWSGLDGLIARGGHEVAVLRLIRDRGIPPDRNAPIRLLVGVQEMERIIQKAAEIADAA